jgi:ABC-2 type transport system ATP-binding protein
MLAITATGLTKVFKRGKSSVTAVDHVDLSVDAGKILGLIGPNGAGKTTLVSILATLIAPTVGDASIFGFDLVRQPRQVRGLIAANATAGERGFYFRINARDNLQFFAALQGLSGAAANRRVDEMLEKIGLAEFAKLRYYEFSAGMKRRLQLARALLVDRRLYLLDEPTSAIDPHSALLIRGLLAELKDSGKTVVLVTHNMDEATSLCDEVTLMYRGGVIRHDSPEALRRYVPPSEIAVELVSELAADAVSASLKSLPSVQSIRRESGRLRVQTANPDADIHGLLFWSASQKEVVGVNIVRPQLSDSFVQLVEEATGEKLDPIVMQAAGLQKERRRPHW